VDVAVPRPAEHHGSAGIAPLQLTPGHFPAPHPPRYGTRQEVVTGEATFAYTPAAQLASLFGARFEVLISW